MRIILSCLLVGFLTACQTTKSSTNLFAGNTRFPDTWITKSFRSGGLEGTVFACPPTQCAEPVLVAVAKQTARDQSPTSSEDFLRLKSVNEPLLRDLANLHTTSKAGTIEIKTVRKINSEPLGFYFDGTTTNSNTAKRAHFAVESRFRGNQMVTALAFSLSAKSATSSLRLVDLPRILNRGQP